MLGPISAAKQEIEDRRRQGVPPLVRDLAPRPAQEPTPAKWLCGLDLGMMNDHTALAILRKSKEERNGKMVNCYACLHLQRWIGVDYPSIAEEVRPLLAQLTPPATLIVDQTGVGVGVAQILRRARLPVAGLKGVTITSGHQTTYRPDGGFNVPKKELVAAGQSALQGKRLAIAPKLADAKVLRRELQNFKVKISVNATETYEAWREGDHDDLVLTVCMATWYGEQGGCRLGAENFFFGESKR
jgi:hypothetical protein